MRCFASPTLTRVYFDREAAALGLRTEMSEVVEGSNLYWPAGASMANVVLPRDQKQLVLSTVRNFETFKAFRQQQLKRQQRAL